VKTKLFLASIALLAICSWTNPSEPEFLYLNAAQLKPLGIVLNQNGAFYRNLDPNWRQVHSRYAGLMFYSCADNYLSTKHYAETDLIKANNKDEKILLQLETTHNDFCPLLIGNPKGQMSLDDKTIDRDIKLLPIAICMSETKVHNRKDTLVVWFRPTEALQKALPANINMEKFLKTRPITKM